MKFLKYWEYLSPLLLILPVNVYIIGNFLGAGVAFTFFKFQITYLGTSVYSIVTELHYVLDGTFHHKTAVSVILWALALLLLIIAVILLLFRRMKWTVRKRAAGGFMIISSLLFLGAIFEQYSLTFHGPSGTAIPVGIPLLIILGCWIYLIGTREIPDEPEEIEEDLN